MIRLTQYEFDRLPAAPCQRVLNGFVLGALLAAQGVVMAAAPDVSRARQLVVEGRDQDAYELLQPFEASSKDDAVFNLLLGEAALCPQGAGQAEALFERSLAAMPDSVPAHLGLGRAYAALGDHVNAKVEFETVLRFDDLQRQAEIYAAAALPDAKWQRAKWAAA